MTYGFVTDVENGIHDASRRDGSPRFLDASFATRHLLTPRTASCVHMLTSSAEVLTSPNQGGWSRSQLQSNEAETSSLTLWLTALLSQASRQPLPDCCAGGLHGGKLFPWPEHFIRRETPGFALAHLISFDFSYHPISSLDFGTKIRPLINFHMCISQILDKLQQ